MSEIKIYISDCKNRSTTGSCARHIHIHIEHDVPWKNNPHMPYWEANAAIVELHHLNSPPPPFSTDVGMVWIWPLLLLAWIA